MKVITTEISGLKIIKPEIFCDDRGVFMETWQKQKFENLVSEKPTQFVQDNYSKSKKGVLRGLHYQSKNTQGKLVRVVSGEVFDVAVDIRKNSRTFGKWFGLYLSAENQRQLWIPEGFAHGFYVTSDEAEFIYKCTNYYDQASEKTLLWNDPDLDIGWPLDQSPILSTKDADGDLLSETAGI